MGIRSDVLLCIKNEAYKALSDQSKETIKDWMGDYADRGDEGMIFYTAGVKWYNDMNSELNALYEDMGKEDIDEGDYLIVVACSEYPTDNGGDIGDWWDNPWGAHKAVSVTAEWTPFV